MIERKRQSFWEVQGAEKVRDDSSLDINDTVDDLQCELIRSAFKPLSNNESLMDYLSADQ